MTGSHYIEKRREVMELDSGVEFLLRRNLSDAGCDATVVERFFRFQAAGRSQEQYRLLLRHRQSLLEQLHAAQKRIDSLDFLIDSMKSAEKSE